MSLINVTRVERNGKPSVSDDLITTDKIAYAIREIGGEAYISVIESPLTGRGSENIVIGNYLVAESVATICATTSSLFTATVVTRDGNTPSAGYTALGFVAEKIMGPIMTEGAGAKFLYHEDNASNPVVYIVSETPAAIIAQTGTGTLPTPDNGVLIYKALLTQVSTDAPTAIVLENTTGATVVSAYLGVGTYSLTFSSGVLTTDKTLLLSGTSGGGNLIQTTLNSTTEILVETKDYTGTAVNDNLLASAILIEVYP